MQEDGEEVHQATPISKASEFDPQAAYGCMVLQAGLATPSKDEKKKDKFSKNKNRFAQKVAEKRGKAGMNLPFGSSSRGAAFPWCQEKLNKLNKGKDKAADKKKDKNKKKGQQKKGEDKKNKPKTGKNKPKGQKTRKALGRKGLKRGADDKACGSGGA